MALLLQCQDKCAEGTFCKCTSGSGNSLRARQIWPPKRKVHLKSVEPFQCLELQQNTFGGYSQSAMSKSVHCVALLFCLTFVLPHFPIVSSDANSKLKKCCSKLNKKTDDKYCVERFCDFDAISQANVLNFMSTCKDRGETVGHMWDCASSRVDHSKCCKEKGVSETCMAYCSAQDGALCGELQRNPGLL
uniref:DB domain-containing protein n=1 Tax=Globodera pallida TaxID=36090 RepID=A0A183CF89_GLOPA